MPEEGKERQRKSAVKPEAIRIGRNLLSDDLEVEQRVPRGQWTSNLWHHTISAIQALAGSGMRLLRADGEGRLRVVDERILPSPYPVEVTNPAEIGAQPPYRVYRLQDIGRIQLTLGFLLPPAEYVDMYIVPTTGWMYKVCGINMDVMTSGTATAGYYDIFINPSVSSTPVLTTRWNYNQMAGIWWHYLPRTPQLMWPPSEATWLDAINGLMMYGTCYLNWRIINNTNGYIDDDSTIECIYLREKVSV